MLHVTHPDQYGILPEGQYVLQDLRAAARSAAALLRVLRRAASFRAICSGVAFVFCRVACRSASALAAADVGAVASADRQAVFSSIPSSHEVWARILIEDERCTNNGNSSNSPTTTASGIPAGRCPEGD